MPDTTSCKIGILVVAYNAASTLLATLDRIPTDFRNKIAEVIVLDDASKDDTHIQGHAWAQRSDTPNTLVLRHTKNLGYGGNQKAAYAMAIERGISTSLCYCTATASTRRSYFRRWSRRWYAASAMRSWAHA